jgi:hypothetical protein
MTTIFMIVPLIFGLGIPNQAFVFAKTEHPIFLDVSKRRRVIAIREQQTCFFRPLEAFHRFVY